MINNLYKSKVADLIKKSKEKGLIKTYSEFCKTRKGEESELSEDETSIILLWIKERQNKDEKVWSRGHCICI